MAPLMTTRTSTKRHTIARSFLVPAIVFGLLAIFCLANGRQAPGQKSTALFRRDAPIDVQNPMSQSKDKDLEVSLQPPLYQNS